MELDLELAKRKTYEYVTCTSFALLRSEFPEYDGLYLFSSENLSYLENMDVKGKKALTVTGSFDQCLNLIFLGC